jgi:hypothetical protein
MPTTYTIDQTITPATSNSSVSITINQSTSKTVEISSPYNKNRLQKRLTTNIPIIFSTKDNTDPVIVYSRPDYQPPTPDPVESWDQEQKVDTYTTIPLGDSSLVNKHMAQSFQLSSTQEMIRLVLKLGTEPLLSSRLRGDWNIRIETDSASKPSSTLVHANASVSAVYWIANTVVIFDFTPFTLIGATTYWIVVTCYEQTGYIYGPPPASLDNYAENAKWYFCGTTPSAYTNGSYAYRTANTQISPVVYSAWTVDTNYDLYFRIRTRTIPVVPDLMTFRLTVFARESLVNFYHFFTVNIKRFIDAVVEGLITSYTIGKNITQTITMAFGAIIPTSASITISETISMTDTSLDTDNDQDATDNGAIEPTATASSSSITISQTTDKTNTIGTEYSTVVA